MKNFLPIWLLAATALVSPAMAQTSSLCDPTKKDGCAADPALASSKSYDFTKGASSDFRVEGQAPTYDANGANFLASAANTATTLVSNWYMMFGYVEVTLKAAKGNGIVSAMALLSDDLDEIDWEMVGPDGQNAQTNYFGKGCACGYGRGTTISAPNCQQQWHTYKVEWKADQITWWVDDNKAAARVLTQANAAKGQWPQTPMQLKIGIWASLDKNAWSGGPATFKDGPNVMQVKSVKAIDYSTGKSYSYGDKSGTWQSIKSDGGVINPNGNSNVQPNKDTSSSSTVASTSGTSSYSASTSVSGTVSGSSSASVTDSSSTSTCTTTSGSATGSDSSSVSNTDSSSVTATDSTATSATETTADSTSATPTCTILTITSDSMTYTITSSYTRYVNSSTSATGDSTESGTATDSSATATDSSATATETGSSTETIDSPSATDSSSSDSGSGSATETASVSSSSPSPTIQPGAGAALKAQGVSVAIVAVLVAALFI